MRHRIHRTTGYHNGERARCAFCALVTGYAVCLYAYSHLSFAGDGFAEVCAEHYHLLREYALGHPEAGAILGAID